MGRHLSWQRGDLEVDPVSAARALLGSTLRCIRPDGAVTVRLTEVEAYAGPDDPGSHAYRGPSKRNATMFGEAGLAYVYFTHGMHWCLNVVCGPPGVPGAVLLRAGEIVEGEDVARARRPRSSPRDLARGPARLTQALGVSGGDDGVDLLSPRSPLRLLAREEVPDSVVAWGPRVGVAGAGAPTPWRAHLRDHPSVSLYRPAVRRRKPGASA
jgi:DNA-3-methyladenine glycosylase